MTVQQNRFVDGRLAHGLAKQLLDEVRQTIELQERKSLVGKGIKTLKSRKKVLSNVAKRQGDLLLDALAFDQYRKMRMITLNVGTYRESLQDVLCANIIELRLSDRKPSVVSPQMNDTIAGTDLGTLCAFSQHSIERFVQRNQVRRIADLVATVKLGAQWSTIATYVDCRSSFMIPVADGLICCGMDVPLKNEQLRKKGVKGVNIRTFIGLNDMRPATRNRWQRLTDIGALDQPPRALKNSVSDQHIKIFESMAQEGRKWDARQAS